MAEKINLNAYFERIGFAGSIAPTLATLELILSLHAATIPIDNLDAVLGLAAPNDLEGINRKLVTERRGGGGAENNRLLAAVLRELDYPVRMVASRAAPEAGLANHLLPIVDIGGTSYLADVGAGASTPTAPLRLRADAEQATPHGIYRLTGGSPDWQVERKQGEDWLPLYGFTHPSEATEGSDEPSGSEEIAVALSPAGRRLILSGTVLRTLADGAIVEEQLIESASELRTVLTERFGITLPEGADAALAALFPTADPSTP
jgi:N-hydroxyarylamine O-acetyltransferase